MKVRAGLKPSLSVIPGFRKESFDDIQYAVV